MTKPRSALVSTRPPRISATAESLTLPDWQVHEMMIRRGVPDDWGCPILNLGWFDEDDKLLALNAGYANGHTAHLRIRARDWRLSFGFDSSLLPPGEAAA